MKVEIEDYGAGPRILIYFMQGHAHAITVAQALELRNMIDGQIRAVELRNEAVQRYETDAEISEEDERIRKFRYGKRD